MKRAIATALAAGTLCVVVAVILGRHELIERYYVYQITRDESRFDELLREGGELKRRALKRYLRTADGQEFLARRCEKLLRMVPERMRREPNQRQDWLEGSSFGSLAMLPDRLVRVADGHMFHAFPLQDEMFENVKCFLGILDDSLGVPLELSGAPDVTAEIAAGRVVLPRSGYFPRLENGSHHELTVYSDPSQGPPADWTEEHAQALGDHPALFYSRE